MTNRRRSHIEDIIVDVVFVILLILVLTMSYSAHAGPVDNDCQYRAELVQTIKQQYDKGTSKSRLLLAFQGPQELDRVMRNVIHAVYRGQYDQVTSDTMYQVTFDVCNNQRGQ